MAWTPTTKEQPILEACKIIREKVEKSPYNDIQQKLIHAHEYLWRQVDWYRAQGPIAE